MAIDESRTFKPINIAVLTVSDTRTPETDTSGDILADRVTGAGHNLAARMIVKDDAALLAAQFEAWIDDPSVDAVVSTGGTGLTGRDVTPEALGMITAAREIPGFGELFRQVSVLEIGTSSLQSRALAGFANSTLVCCLPGSPNACRTAWQKILGEQLDSRTRPCNFVPHLKALPERPVAACGPRS